MDYVLGIDGGGTKTLLCAAKPDGTELFCLEGGAINMNGISPSLASANIEKLVREATERMCKGDCLVSVCIGAAGISNPLAAPTLAQGLQNAGVQCPVQIVGDHVTALYGALQGKPGVLLISGTGSICTALSADGATARSGGRGHLIDDEGSGYAIGRDILSAVVRAQDRRSSPTVLTNMVLDALQIDDIEQIISYVYTLPTDKSKIARLAKLLPEACRAQDTAALAIRSKAVRELLLLCKGVCKALCLYSGSVAIAGSILQKDAGLQTEFRRSLAQKYSHMEIMSPIDDAMHGAVILALKVLQQ